MDFFSFPADIKRIIFSKLDFKSLKTAKLVSKEFCIFIEANMNYMERPKLHEISLFEYLDLRGASHYQVHLAFYPSCTSKKEKKLLMKFFSVDCIHLNDFCDFLYGLNFKNIKIIQLISLKNTDILKKIGDCYDPETNLDSLKIDVSDCKKNLKNISYLLCKIKHTKELKLNICTSFENKPLEITIPIHDSLRLLHIGEIYNTKFITKEMVCNLINNNPKLQYLYFDSKRFYIYIEIVQVIMELQFSRKNKGCFHTSYKIFFPYTNNLSLYEDFEKLFSKFKYEFATSFEPVHNNFYTEAFLPCNSCEKFDSLYINYE